MTEKVSTDLPVTDKTLLQPEVWSTLASDDTVDVRAGEADDPLLGVVRIRAPDQRDVDIVVGRDDWQRKILSRAQDITIGPHRMKVATPADLVLLKLFAGGSQDRWDIEQLLALDRDGAIRQGVGEGLAMLPARSRALWRDFRRADQE